MKIAFFSTKTYDRTYFDQLIEQTSHTITYFEDLLTEKTATLVKGYDAVCVFVNNPVDRPLLEKISELGIEVVALRSAGFNHVDLEAAQDLGVKIFRVPAYSPEAVAEHTAALILTLNRKTHKAYNRVRENNFSLDGLAGFNLHQKTVGVIGTGTIGTAFCKIMTGFGCDVLAFDPNVNEEAEQIGVSYVDLDELFKKSDIVSLHCPLIPQTRHMINESSISKMKTGVMIINTSRGALIDTAAVINALKQKKIGFLGIDVYEQEENLFFEDLSEEVIQDDEITRLMAFPNALITGHQAFLTAEALREITKITLQNLTDYEEGKPVENEIKAG
ncbi:2-hydroxyacid dehydrogenase [Rhodohalobacter sp. SW132]|uniref:2-hydroxyacid dehydrogenase n=1 Tax=Rhodohalobacter sp. SW132 TaxID=2293433 RepID=UPI000E21DAD8|nr:2-hydroxyacid dehydrogenase [Rhodohalobacter sp. SW132]REL29161.1 2-hydroxyacid dehydrogenase [Rhodohalobacter sp. SW132]